MSDAFARHPGDCNWPIESCICEENEMRAEIERLRNRVGLAEEGEARAVELNRTAIAEIKRLRERVAELEMARDEYVAVKRGAAQNFVDAYSAASKYESETAEILWFQSAQAKVFDEFRRALAEIGGEDV